MSGGGTVYGHSQEALQVGAYGSVRVASQWKTSRYLSDITPRRLRRPLRSQESTGIDPAKCSVRILNNGTSGIDLNGLEGPEVNLVENCEAVGSASGFGLALSSCQNTVVRDFTSSSNGFGDIGILGERIHS